MTIMQKIKQKASSSKLFNRLFYHKKFIRKRIQRFFASRTPHSDKVKLTLKNVYIFFSREGILFALLLLITFITGINYGNNLVLGLCFYLVSIWLISVHITFSHVSGLKFHLLNVSMAEAGKPVWVTIQIINTASKPSRQLSVHFDQTDYIETMNIGNHKLRKSAYTVKLSSIKKTETLRLPILTHQRGRMELPRLIISSVYPLGIMRAWSYVYFESPAWVYPKPINFKWENQQSIASEDENRYSHVLTKGQNDFDMLDEYQEGESLSRISWAHVARGHGMLTKHFADSVGRELKVDYSDMPASHHEQKLGQLTYVVQALAQENQAFILNLPNNKGELGLGSEFIQSSLLRLAKMP